ncbi:MAG: alpha/beta hydrolase [Deltaproteobacteria bacterium]|nr:alpha/beta hydrolase [Deltaproteobacteria bacterium]
MTIQCEICGNGPEKVIALHDWMSTHRSFEDVQPYLSQDRFTYAFADLRGYGKSRDLQGKYSVQEAVGDVVDLAAFLGWEKFHVLGHSMSGMVAQRLSLVIPDRLESQVLVTPVTASGVPLDEEGRKLFEGAVNDDELWEAVARAVTGDRLGAGFYQRKLEQHRAAVDPEAFGCYLEMWTETNFSAEMKGLKTPTLVIAGAHDFPTFSKEGYEQSIGQWYLDSRIDLFANAGHYPMSETPPYFAQTVEAFFQASSGRASSTRQTHS